ncbi:MAG: hypothetical protein UGF45_07710 [Massilioclostridium sp.]|nr:hypothetical protein [Massilioclostridium sp.]MEE1491892.1 hypothetical protein [Massilioclostridium sp.]
MPNGEVAEELRQDKSFGRAFSKARGFQRQCLWAFSAENAISLPCKSLFEGEFCRKRKKRELSCDRRKFPEGYARLESPYAGAAMYSELYSETAAIFSSLFAL